MPNYYQLLGLQENATNTDIKKAYRQLAKKFHPDLNPKVDTTAKFIEIEEAYSCLIDSSSRMAYDRLLKFGSEGVSRPTSTSRKYSNDVKRKASRARNNAAYRANMNYRQFKRDDLLRHSGKALLFQTIFFLITAVLIFVGFYQACVAWYGDDTKDWPENLIYLFAFLYVPLLSLITAVYEPLVKYIVVGKPKRKKKV